MQSESLFTDKVLAVIVLYKVPLNQSRTYLSLLKNLPISLFVYDNSPLPQHAASEFGPDIVYVHDPRNGGLSKAYNLAASYAMSKGKAWILLLDQDTAFPFNAIIFYQDAVERNPEIKLFAPLLKQADGSHFSPYTFKRRGNLKFLRPGTNSFRDFSPVNSGMLISVTDFIACGGYNDRVRLDFADHQFIERFQQNHHDFFLMAMECVQDSSNEETDLNKLSVRFVMFCESASNCDIIGLHDRLYYFYIVFKRMLALMLRTRSLVFVRIFIKEYLLQLMKNKFS